MTTTEGTVSTVTTEQRIREFVLDYFYVTDPDALTDETSLIDSGIVDSTGMMGVILYLESEFGIQVGDRDATPENLGSIARIADFVTRKQAADGA
jgi:acyl carrier protein